MLLKKITLFFQKYLLSGAMFASGFFAILAPLPLLQLFFFKMSKQLQQTETSATGEEVAFLDLEKVKTPQLWVKPILVLGLSLLTNALFVYGIYRSLELTGLYLAVSGMMTLVMIYCLLKRMSFVNVCCATVGLMMIAVIGVVVYGEVSRGGWQSLHQIKLFSHLKADFNLAVDAFLQQLNPEQSKQVLSKITADEFKSNLWVEMPYSVVVTLLLSVVLNFVILTRSSLSRWKLPFAWVWVLLGLWGLVLLTSEPASLWLMNGVKVVLTLFVIQGLGVMSVWFEALKFRGFLKIFGFVSALFFVMPLTIAVGFFDEWFDFRSKIRQS